ncbi:MAG: hypothetical protein IJB59_05445 [Oscillospiraceae bacterium]|nr:hypothetical protein [Oscillospiraceae bacterium]
MNSKEKIWSGFLIGILIALVCLYFAGILWINVNARVWFNFDLYADAKLAQIISQTNSLFPEGWTFGNQFYIIATPVISALICNVISDPAAALGIASSVMTVILMSSFLWCIWPFVKKENIPASLFCFIGGILISNGAATDFSGIQIFFTMGSYYACYLFGILLTMGIWLRIQEGLKVRAVYVILCYFVNIALGMQSLREMLSLNLPLCALSIYFVLRDYLQKKRIVIPKTTRFSLVCLWWCAFGIGTMSVLKRMPVIQQNDILTFAETSFLDSVTGSINALAQYIGLIPDWSCVFGCFSFFAALALTAAVLFSVIYILITDDRSAVACMILFCAISIAAVFCAGIFVIVLRDIYFFVWHLLATLCITYLLERFSSRMNLKRAVLLILSAIGTINLYFSFAADIQMYREKESFYREISDTLISDGITHVYYNIWGMNDAARIAASSEDRLLFCAVTPNFTEAESNADHADLLAPISYLCYDEWYSEEADVSAYLCLNGTLLESGENQEYYRMLQDHVTLTHRFVNGGEDYCFYAFDKELYQDIIHADS